MKQKISVWELLVWVYQHQSTRHMIDGQRSDRLGWGRISMTQKAIGTARQGVNIQETNCRVGHKIHDDCWMVHNVMAGLPERYPKEYWPALNDLKNRVVLAAENGVFPAWLIEREPLRILPVINPVSGKDERMWRNGRAFACLIKYQGHSIEEIERLNEKAKSEYQFFYDFLKSLEKMIVENGLCSFAVQGLGVPDKPWVEKRVKVLEMAD